VLRFMWMSSVMMKYCRNDADGASATRTSVVASQ
jgi:hypothetical protein